jgi:pimeloyl-ACP methyl ester carboxylesterase
MSIHTAIVSISGNLQTGEAQSGMEDLYFQVTRYYTGKHVTAFDPRRWNANLDQLLWRLVRQQIHQVVLIGYSWGAGYTSIKFAKRAEQFGIKIPLALLCDPVYRPTWMPSWLPPNPLNIYSLDRRTKIKVPRTIKKAVYLRQQRSIPHGHELTPIEPASTEIHDKGFVPYSHLQIDEAPEWFSLVKTELTNHFENGNTP